ncbi:MAG TPA: hypothetical protein VK989_19810 [Polyangia bacterium]|nr:hypothetical protein [Polyangia bacterium]
MSSPTMGPIDARKQLAVVRRMLALVDEAKAILGDESCLDILEGAEGQNLTELQNSLIDASACLRALRQQMKARVEALGEAP